MTLKEMVMMSGSIPSNAVMENGTRIELVKTQNAKGFTATIWTDYDDDIQNIILCQGKGETIDLAKEDLKRKILNEL